MKILRSSCEVELLRERLKLRADFRMSVPPPNVLLSALFAVAVTVLASVSTAQESTSPPPAPASGATTDLPMRLDLSRRDLKNFLTDPEAMKPYLGPDGTVADLHDVFALGSPNAPWAVFWDSRTCRLLGILDLEAQPESPAPPSPAAAGGSDDATGAREQDADREPGDGPDAPLSPYLYRASGAFPLAKTSGASGEPRYFGFRLVKEVPEFLYTCGTLSIEERLWLDDGGRVLRQRFSAKEAAKGLQISVPESWKGRVTASAGTWKGSVLTVPADSAAEVILTYPLAADPAGASENATPATN